MRYSCRMVLSRDMSKKRDISDEEKALWKEAVKDVARIKPSKLIKPKLAEKTIVKIKKQTSSSLPDILAPRAKNAIDPNTKAKIGRGDYVIDGRIDLHGFTFDNAYDALAGFITQHHFNGSRCLLVITGKGGKHGGNSLKEDVPRWLSFAAMSNMVAYHTPAQAKHGGTGALYVYLTRKR